MPDESVCRVLIVDNELDYAAQTAAKLEEIRPSLLSNNRLEIELTNNAYFAAERLRRCPAGEPPWDVIISDVYMPFPCQAGKPDTPELEASLTHYQTDGKAWRSWEFPYPSSELEEKVEHGGFHIAETIAARLAAGEDMPDLKMILMSNCLEGADRDQILLYQATRSSWLKYYDKANWRRDQLTSWPKLQSAPNVFQWALFLAIAERKKVWGRLFISDNVPDVQAVIGETATLELKYVIDEAVRLARACEIEVVMLTGEVGTGREVFARLIHNVRMRELGLQGEFVAMDCSSISYEAFERELFDYVQEAAGGTLFIDEVDKLTPPHQGKIYHLLKDKKLRGSPQVSDFAAQLAICTASGAIFEDLKGSEMFHADLYYLLKDEQLHIAPLRERPADAVSIAEVLAQQTGGVMLADDARQWIEAYQWPGNNKELRGVITAAARRALTAALTADDLETVRSLNRRTKRSTKPEENPIATEPHGSLIRSQVPAHKVSQAIGDPTDEKYMFRKEGDYWRIRFEGKESLVKSKIGLQLIAQLLQNPRKQFSVFELGTALGSQLAADERKPMPAAIGDEDGDIGLPQEKIDAKARKEYELAVSQLEDELEIATQLQNITKMAELREEISEIKRELKNVLGLRGRSRNFTNEFDRVRRTVWARYNRALESISEHDEALWRHLKNGIKTGKDFVYQPEKIPNWKF